MASSDGRIAIIGMACRFPGGAHNPEAFWSLLMNGQSTIEEIPQSRFNIDEYWCKDGGEINRMMVRQGHFLREGDFFDEKFFNLSPREAMNTDPQHRILLECVVDALDDAGYKPDDAGGERGWVKSRMGVFVGSATDSYQNNLTNNIDAFFCPGTIRGFASGRISHHFGFQGPSVVYDTACSSGLVSLHSACQSLLLNECDAAIASGTNMLTSPEMFIGLSKGFFISNTGGCRTFDETADGYCRAEGVGVLVLKRLEDAIRDNDKVESIIIASGINQSGPAESLTTPHAPTQSMLFESNCNRACIPPLSIRAVEAHGTGTQAGDYAEMEAIKRTFCSDRPQGNTSSTLFVSSLKPNIGHAESTSGIASVMKAVLMLRHKTIPPHIGITTRLNPRLGDLAAHGIVIPTTQQPLQPVAGYSNVFISVNNFGAPGGNANVILQDTARIAPGQRQTDPRTHHIVTLSAKVHTPFQIIASRMLDRLKDVKDTDLSSLSYTTTVRRIDYPVRRAFSVSSVDELKRQLRKATVPTNLGAHPTASIGFAIGGNGSQFPGMAKMLYNTSPIFRTRVDQCNGVFKGYGGPGFLGIITGDLDPFYPAYDNFLCASMSIFSVGYAMGIMWREWGVNPSVIVGHSLGEYAAFVLAGCLSVEDAVQLIIWRTQALYATEGISSDGGMIVIGVGEVDTQRILKDSGCSGLVISCYNGPAQTCVSGSRGELLKLQAFTQALPQAPLVKVLQSQFPWHSPILKDAAEHFRTLAESIIFHPAKVAMVLNINASVLRPGDIPPSSYLVEQMVKPVRFDLCASETTAQGVNIWIELSARSLLLPLLRSLVSSGVAFLPTLGAGTECWRSITLALARLYEAQVPIEWATYHKPYQPQLITLPSYPFARNKHWIEYRDRLHLPEYFPSAEFPVIISTAIGPLEIIEPWRRYILHTNGQYLHPGVYIWLAFSCTKGTNVVADFQVTTRTTQRSYLTVLVGAPSPVLQAVSFVQHNKERTLENGILVASCKVEVGFFSVTLSTEKIFQRSRTKMLSNPASSFFGKAMVSKLLKASMEMAGSDHTLMTNLTVSDDGMEAVGRIRWDDKDVFPDHSDSFLSPVTFSPPQLQSLLQPACLAMFLGSGTVSPSVASYAIDRLDFTKDLPPSSDVKDLCVHVFIDDPSDNLEQQDVSSQSHIYSQSGSILARVSGLRKLVKNPTDTHTQLSLKLPSSQPENHVHQTMASIPSPPDSTTLGEPIPSRVKWQEFASGDRKTLTETVITDVLSQELGIPSHSILAGDKLEDLGVDSIMSLLLRDRLRQLVDHPIEWFTWKMGLSVQDLWNYVLPVKV